MVYTLIDSTSETGSELWIVKRLPKVFVFFVFGGVSWFFLVKIVCMLISILDGQMLSTSINGSLWSTHPCNGLLWSLGLWQLRSRPKLGWSISDDSSHMFHVGYVSKFILENLARKPMEFHIEFLILRSTCLIIRCPLMPYCLPRKLRNGLKSWKHGPPVWLECPVLSVCF